VRGQHSEFVFLQQTEGEFGVSSEGDSRVSAKEEEKEKEKNLLRTLIMKLKNVSNMPQRERKSENKSERKNARREGQESICDKLRGAIFRISFKSTHLPAYSIMISYPPGCY
jgi:hypothetical protein